MGTKSAGSRKSGKPALSVLGKATVAINHSYGFDLPENWKVNGA
jgi:hypothetical protein